jgi:hypothetical protein
MLKGGKSLDTPGAPNSDFYFIILHSYFLIPNMIIDSQIGECRVWG